MSFANYLSDRELTVTESEAVLELKASDFFELVKFCSEPPAELLAKAKYIVAYAYSSNGGGFNSQTVVDTKNIIEKSSGAGSVRTTKKYSDNAELSGIDSVSQLKKIPSAYNLLKDYLCVGSKVGAFVV